VVDTFIRIHRDIVIVDVDEPERREVLGQINRALQGEPAAPVAAAAAPVGAADEVLAFVSLSRLAAGNGSPADVLALSTNLIRRLVPLPSGAWFVPGEGGDRLTVADAFGPAASLLRGVSMLVGDKLTGWVAANRQAIVNSDAALDLGARAAQASPALVSCMSVPLLAGDTLVAVLTLYADERDAFSDDLGRLMQVLAPHIATALHGAREHAAQPQISAGRDLKLVAARA
jgi:GAF domain-containing protein